MMLKRCCTFALVIMVASMVITAPVFSSEPYLTFRQENKLQAYVPPEWFLSGYFLAREKNPAYVFGPVQDFVETIGGTVTWLIEDMELERLEAASANEKKVEYTLYLETVSSDRMEYWVFVVMPHKSAQAWYDARRAYHGRKAEEYYGKTQIELERALDQGLSITAELRFWIENGETSLQTPEDVIMKKYKLRPVFDLNTGRKLSQAIKND